MRPLSIVFPFYRNQRMLYRQYLVMAGEWSDAAKAQVEVIVVDDGSPEPAIDVDRPAGLPPLSIYRVLENRKWHQHGARNLGAKMAAHPWLLLTDIDHVIPPDTLSEVLATDARTDRVYTFGRVDAPVDPWRAGDASTMTRTTQRDGKLKPHVNSFAMARKLFWRVGGYDEDLCGIYGTDHAFRQRLYQRAMNIELTHAPLIRVARDVIPDASTREWDRKEGRVKGDKKILTNQVKAAKAARGEAGRITVLNFPWERAL